MTFVHNLCTSLVTGRLINLTQVLYKISNFLSVMAAQMYGYCPGTNSMELSPSSEGDWSSTSKIPLNWWYLHVHYHIHKCQPPVSILNQIHPVHASPSNLLEIHFAIILPSMPRSSKWFHSLRSPNQKTVHISPFSHTCHMHFPSDSWFGHEFVEVYRSWILLQGLH